MDLLEYHIIPHYAIEIVNVLQIAPTLYFGGLTGILPAVPTRYALVYYKPKHLLRRENYV